MQKIRLLYVEDDDGQRKALAALLRKKGFHVTVATSGETGIKYFATRSFDAVLCDLHMPGKSGEAVLDFVRKKDRIIPFIILSSHGTVSKAVKTIKKGADHFIIKPADVNEITIAVTQAIERKQLEANLADSQATLQMVAESVPDIMYSLSTKADFLSLSPAVTSSMGYKPDELLGTSVFAIIHPEDRLRVMKDFERTMLSGGKSVRNLQFRMVSKKGEVKHFEVSRRLIFKEGRIVRIDGIARDDTERVRLQNKLEEYSQNLELMVKDRTENLEYTNRQLSALTRVSNEINKIFDEEKLLDKVSKLLTRTLDFDRAYLVLEGENGTYVRSWCPGGGNQGPMEKMVRQFNKGSLKLPPQIGESIKKRKTIFVRDVKSDRRWPAGPKFTAHAKSVVISPLTVKHKAIGAIIGSMDDREREMNAQDVNRFNMFANIVSLALDNIRVYQSMELKIKERTESLEKLNRKLESKAAELEDNRVELAYANVDLLAAQEDLQEKNDEMQEMLKELSKRSRELEAVIDANPNVVILVDGKGTIQVINRRIHEYFGISQEDAIGKSFDKLAKSIKGAFEKPKKFLSLLKELDKNPDVAGHLDLSEFYNRGLSVAGETPLILSPLSFSLLDENKQETGSLWILSNITKIKQADRQIHAIVKASPIPTIISRIEDGKILYANEHLAELVASTPEDLLGRSTLEFYHHHEDRNRMLDVVRNQGFINDYEVQIKRLDGTLIWVIMSIVITEVAGENVILGTLYDISYRKHFEEALEKERNFVSAVLDTAGALIMVMDREGKIVRFNRTCEESSGYKFDEVRNKPAWGMFTAAKELKEIKARHRKLCDGDFPVEAEAFLLTKTGERRLISWSNTCLLDSDGNVEFVVAIGLDITSQRKAEEAITNRLRYEEGLAALSQTLLTRTDSKDALPVALRHLLEAADASRVYIFENFEDEKDGLCMRQIFEVNAPGVEPQIDNPELQHIPYDAGPARWRKMLESGKPLTGLVRNFSDEEKAILEPQGILSIACIPFKVEGKWHGYVGFDDVKTAREWSDEDIRTLRTAAEIIGIYIERKKFEVALRVSEERFRSLIENANAIIYSLTPRGEFSYLSPMVVNLLGYEPGELLGKSIFPFLHPDDEQKSHEWFRSGIRDHADHDQGYEFRMIHKDGSTRWFSTNASIILDGHGAVMELIGVAHDITQLKKILAEIEQTNRYLKETQAQLAQSEKMASLGMLVAGIAHEINTPVGAVNSMHDTLVRSVNKLKGLVEKNIPAGQPGYQSIEKMFSIIDDSNKVIESGTERVTNIVRRLRSFARLDEAELKTVDIHEGLEDTLTLIHHDIKHDISVVKEYGEIPPIACFPGQLNQVFLNLLVNARQAIKGKGEITITTFIEHDNVVLKIRDTGTGISKDHLAKIFDPGFTTKGVGVGTGLGLAICYKIIQAHKGEISVESESGKGTAFTIVLPMNLDRILENNQM